MLPDLAFDIQSLKKTYADGIKPSDIIRETYQRIKTLDDAGVFLALRDEAAVIEEAEELGSKPINSKPLWGLPFAIKDNIDAGGLPTTAGCPAFSYTPANDAFLVARLREEGALLIGKTNMDQFATGLVGTRTPHRIPKNAIDPQLVPGGSSSGSAIAVAHGLVSFALGTDTAGSGRVPAALNGIVGLKPSLGALSNSGVVPACRTLDCVSIFALTPSDAFEIFQAAVDHDKEDPYSKIFPKPQREVIAPHFRVGVPDVSSQLFFGDQLQQKSYRETLKALKDVGGEIREIDFKPFYTVADQLYSGPWVAERYAVIEDLINSQRDAVHPLTRKVTEIAKDFSATDTFRAFYLLRKLANDIGREMDTLDVLCVPSVPKLFTRKEVDDDPIGTNNQLGTYTNFVNLLNMCAIAVPVAQREDGYPGGVTLIGPSGADALISTIADALYEKTSPPLGATSWTAPQRASPVTTPNTNETEIVVVGAHMSGLPLNSQLTKRGARFLKVTQTSPDYRLYNLPGGPPMRPGLVRDHSGAAIDIEIWALPLGSVGHFLIDIPSPLGLGTIKLKDGTSVPGFLCESIAAKDAEEITHFGGWRNFLNSLAPETSNKEGI